MSDQTEAKAEAKAEAKKQFELFFDQVAMVQEHLNNLHRHIEDLHILSINTELIGDRPHQHIHTKIHIYKSNTTLKGGVQWLQRATGLPIVISMQEEAKNYPFPYRVTGIYNAPNGLTFEFFSLEHELEEEGGENE